MIDSLEFFFMRSVYLILLVCLATVAQSQSAIRAQQQHPLGTGNKIYYRGDGMSRSFRKFLNGLLIRFNFSHTAEPGSMFDK